MHFRDEVRSRKMATSLKVSTRVKELLMCECPLRSVLTLWGCYGFN